MKNIPFGCYRIDSGHFYIDIALFKSVTIPKEIIWTDSDSGEYIDTVRANGIPMTLRGSTFRIAKDILKVPLKGIELYKEGNFKEIIRVGIYASAKVAADYFEGLLLSDFIVILNLMKDKCWIDFDEIEPILDSIKCSDLDIKVDYKFSHNQRESLSNYFNRLKDSFSGKNPDDCKVYSNAKSGMGISAYERKGATEAHPFHKFYNKSIEIILPKNDKVYKELGDEIRSILRDNMVIRYEMTFKNKKGLNRFGIESNGLKDIYAISDDDWAKISSRLLTETYYKEVFKAPKDPNELQQTERHLLVFVMLEIRRIKRQAIDDGEQITEAEIQKQILDYFLETEETKEERYRAKNKFNRIYHFATKSEPIEYKFNADEMKDWDKFFGIKK